MLLKFRVVVIEATGGSGGPKSCWAYMIDFIELKMMLKTASTSRPPCGLNGFTIHNSCISKTVNEYNSKLFPMKRYLFKH